MRSWIFALVCVVLLVFCACNRNDNNAIVADVYNWKLTTEDLQEMVPLFDKEADSVEILQQYIDSWVVRQVMLHEAKENLSRKEKNFAQQVKEYKEDLLINAYENKMLRQLLDTVVSDEEITMYIGSDSTILDVNRTLIVRSILQQRRMEILKTLRKEAVSKAKESGEVLFY